MVTLQTAENALKTVYLGVVSNQINMHSDVVLSKIQQTTNDVLGKEIRTLSLFKDNKGNYVTLVEELRNLYGTIEISGKAIRASENNAGAFVNLINAECENLIKETIIEIHKQLWSKDREQKPISEENPYLGLTPKMIVGITEIFDTTKDAIYGCNKKEILQLNPTIIEFEEFNEVSLIQAQNLMEEKDSTIDIMVCSYKTRNKIQEELIKDNRDKYMELQGGFKALDINNVPLITVKGFADDKIYLLNTKEFKFHQLCDWQWLENEDGRIFKQKAESSDYNATLVKYGNLICKDISKQGVLKLKE